MSSNYPVPASRQLRVFAFDPSLASSQATESVSLLTLSVPWEALEPGPVGEYIEVVDIDPASDAVYQPVDLNSPHLLATNGFQPSEANPLFHQQMVYAVAMKTIQHFERALGRTAFWAERQFTVKGSKGDERVFRQQFVRRLRIYPHALRDENAYYSPDKKALLFGYFPVLKKDRYNTPGTVVFTCLSYGIVAHEVTHALLDGVHPRFNEPTNPDVHAFHEAFADVVALFQVFAHPQVLESQIAKTRGQLDSENLLSQLAQQFGRATGRGSSLRDALGSINEETGEWEPRIPDSQALEKTLEAHDRGAILVNAIFRAFLIIYRSRSADLFRIASNGTGQLPAGEIDPDLTRRLAADAAKWADRILQVCIRAIDYCPPVNISFGAFLRAVITADLEYAPEDEAGLRTVFIQAFREWGIHPTGVTSIGQDSLVWPSGEDILRDSADYRGKIPKEVALILEEIKVHFKSPDEHWNLEGDRFKAWKVFIGVRQSLHKLVHSQAFPEEFAKMIGLVIAGGQPTIYRKNGIPTLEIHSARPALRRMVSGNMSTDLVIEITQRRRGYFDPEKQAEMDAKNAPFHFGPGDEPDFIYRAGCTLLINPSMKDIRRVIRTPGDISDDAELERVRRYVSGEMGATGNAFDSGLPASLAAAPPGTLRNEPFALLHQEQP